MSKRAQKPIHDVSSLLQRLASPSKEVVFLFGSALTLPESLGQPGVPGTDGVVDIIRRRVQHTRGMKLLEQLDASLTTGTNRYQTAFRFLQGKFGPDESNRVIREAVLLARKPGVDAREILNRALELEPQEYEPACRKLREDISGWHLRPSLLALGRMVAGHQERLGQTVLTTNFDPLIDVAIKHQGGSSHRSVLHGDGSLRLAHGEGTHVVYLHGSWYESDTLHTPAALLQDRRQLKSSLRRLIEGRLLAVFGYGGWDDVLTGALAELADDSEARLDVVWAFHETDDAAIRARHEHVLSLLDKPATRARANFFTGVDLHTFLLDLAERLGRGTARFSAGSIPSSGPTCLSDNTFSGPDEWSPGSLLNARYEVVNFHEPLRESEIQDLRAWCTTKLPTAARLVIGPGGSGKTRLLIEWCKRLRRQGWHAGFLKDDVDDATFTDLLSSPTATCAVIDYAETRGGLGRWLKLLTDRTSRDAARFRLVLLARDEGDWWEAFLQSDDAVRDLLTRSRPRLLRPTGVETSLRTDLFERSFRAFSRKLGVKGAPPSADLSDERFGRTLYVEMAALAALEGLPRGARDLLEGVVNHEARFWLKSLGLAGADAFEVEDFLRRARRTVAALTLRGGVASEGETRALLERVGGPQQPRFIGILRRLYPGTGQDGADDAFLRGLEPDLLGETLVASVLETVTTPRDYLDRVFQNASDGALQSGFFILGRIASSRAEALWTKKWIAKLLESDVLGRARPALRAALALGQSSAYTPLADLLAERLEGVAAADLASEFDHQIPDQTISLGRLAVWSTRTILQRLSREAPDERKTSARAMLLNSLGRRLTGLGEREGALEATSEAADIRRTLARARPDPFLPDLAVSLNDLGNRLTDLGEPEKALEATSEALQIYRTLASARPDAFLPDLAASLTNLGTRLSDLGEHEQAFEATREAVETYRGLVETRPEEFLPSLATTISNLGIRLVRLGELEKALEATRESVKIRRTLVKARPDAYTSDLAMSLNNLGNILRDVGELEKALEATREALEIYRNLASARPDAFLPNLAMCLSNLGIKLKDLDEGEKAVEAMREGVEIYRKLADARPNAILPELARSLDNLGTTLSSLGKHETALAAITEGTEIRQKLANARPDTFLPDLSGSLHNLGIELSSRGEREKALAATKEAVEIRRKLSQARPDEFLADLSESLNSLGMRLWGLGQREKALEAMVEAVAIRRKLAQAQSRVFLKMLVQSLTNLGAMLGELGERQRAISAAREAIKAGRKGAQRWPDAFLPDLAGNLNNLGILLGSLEREEAVKTMSEAIEIRRRLAAVRPGVFPALATSLQELGGLLEELGKGHEAEDCFREADRIRRQIRR